MPTTTKHCCSEKCFQSHQLNAQDMASADGLCGLMKRSVTTKPNNLLSSAADTKGDPLSSLFTNQALLDECSHYGDRMTIDSEEQVIAKDLIKPGNVIAAVTGRLIHFDKDKDDHDELKAAAELNLAIDLVPLLQKALGRNFEEQTSRVFLCPSKLSLGGVMLQRAVNHLQSNSSEDVQEITPDPNSINAVIMIHPTLASTQPKGRLVMQQRLAPGAIVIVATKSILAGEMITVDISQLKLRELVQEEETSIQSITLQLPVAGVYGSIPRPVFDDAFDDKPPKRSRQKGNIMYRYPGDQQLLTVSAKSGKMTLPKLETYDDAFAIEFSQIVYDDPSPLGDIPIISESQKVECPDVVLGQDVQGGWLKSILEQRYEFVRQAEVPPKGTLLEAAWSAQLQRSLIDHQKMIDAEVMRKVCTANWIGADRLSLSVQQLLGHFTLGAFFIRPHWFSHLLKLHDQETDKKVKSNMILPSHQCITDWKEALSFILTSGGLFEFANEHSELISLIYSNLLALYFDVVDALNKMKHIHEATEAEKKAQQGQQNKST